MPEHAASDSADRYRSVRPGPEVEHRVKGSRFLGRVLPLEEPAQIEARLLIPGFALVVAGEEMPRLPPSALQALGAVHMTGNRAIAEGIEVASVRLNLDEQVLGCHTLELEVEEP